MPARDMANGTEEVLRFPVQAPPSLLMFKYLKLPSMYGPTSAEPTTLCSPSGFQLLLLKVCAARGQLCGSLFLQPALPAIDTAMLPGRPGPELHKPYDTPVVPGDTYKLHSTQERMGQILTSAPLASASSNSIQVGPNQDVSDSIQIYTGIPVVRIWPGMN